MLFLFKQKKNKKITLKMYENTGLLLMLGATLDVFVFNLTCII